MIVKAIFREGTPIDTQGENILEGIVSRVLTKKQSKVQILLIVTSHAILPVAELINIMYSFSFYCLLWVRNTASLPPAELSASSVLWAESLILESCGFSVSIFCCCSTKLYRYPLHAKLNINDHYISVKIECILFKWYLLALCFCRCLGYRLHAIVQSKWSMHVLFSTLCECYSCYLGHSFGPILFKWNSWTNSLMYIYQK